MAALALAHREQTVAEESAVAGEPPEVRQRGAADQGPLRVWLARALSLLAPVKPAEVVNLLLLTANVLLLLGSYYLLKTAREPLVLAGGASVKSYASAAQALLLVPVAQLYGLLSVRMPRMRLMALVTGFFVSNLVVFFALDRAGVRIGVPFYIWVGVFNITIIAQFWTFVTDVYTVEQGRRLLAIVGVGAALGGLVGARAARALLSVVGVSGLLLAAAVVLVASLGLTAIVERRTGPRRPELVSVAPADAKSGVQMVLGDRYLQLIAALVVVLNLVNSTGEYILDRTLVAQAHAQTAVPAAQFIAAFKADFFSWVSALGLGLQLLVVSRVMKYLGVGAALFVLPVVAFGGYGLLAAAPLLSVMFFAKVAENGLDYSLQATLRQALYLPVSRATKYRAKPILDTFVVRGGDVVASLLVWFGQRLALGTSAFAIANAALSLVWLVIAWQLGRRHQRMGAATSASAPAPAPV